MSKYKNSGKGCSAWRACWSGLSIALIGNVALLVCSCRTTNESTSIRNLDSLAWDRKVNVTLATTPKSLAKLAIPLDSLRKLPEGATFNNKSGQATASAAFKNDTLFVEASCDSLQNLVYQLEENLHAARDELEQKELAKEPATTPFWVKFKWYLTGVLTMVLLITIKQVKKRWLKKKE